MSIGNHSGDPVDIKQLIEDVAKEPDSGALVLALADAYAAQGEWLHALQHYNTCTGLEDRGVRKWYALYQAARMLEKLDFSPQLITEAYFAAFDHYPEKIEPLVQIARHCRLAGQLTTALDIIQMAMEAESPDCNYYYEPETWAFGRGIEFLRICIALNDKDRALGIADELLAGGQLPTMAESLVRLLRLQVSDPAQARVVLGLSDDAASDEKTVPEPADDNLPANIPEATPKGPPRRLCIGMATFDDYDGVYFSVQALRMYHPEILDQIQILVVDNNPEGAAAEKLKELDSYIPNYRYVPESKVVGTAIRDRIFQESNAEFVLVIDCHVFIVPGALARLLEYLDAHPDSPDLLQGPLLHDDLRTISTHFAPGWHSGMWGTWAGDRRGESEDAPAFDIPMQGCGLFACRREAWPGLNPRFRGFGGEEGYIHEKVRQAGGRTLCLPFLRWMHRFNRPLGVPYPVIWENRVRNYIIGWQELGLETDSIRAHFSESMGRPETESIFEQVAREQSQD